MDVLLLAGLQHNKVHSKGRHAADGVNDLLHAATSQYLGSVC